MSTESRAYTPEEFKALSLDEKRAVRADAIARGIEVRSRLAAAVQLPPLIGTAALVERAERLRAAWIEHALEFVSGTRYGAVRLSLNGASADPLCLFDLGLMSSRDGYADEAELLAVLHKALNTRSGRTFRGSIRDRTSAAWWINHVS